MLMDGWGNKYFFNRNWKSSSFHSSAAVTDEWTNKWLDGEQKGNLKWLDPMQGRAEAPVQQLKIWNSASFETLIMPIRKTGSMTFAAAVDQRYRLMS